MYYLYRILCLLYQTVDITVLYEPSKISFASLGAFHFVVIKIIIIYVSFALTHCGLVTPYGDRDLGQQWLR